MKYITYNREGRKPRGHQANMKRNKWRKNNTFYPRSGITNHYRSRRMIITKDGNNQWRPCMASKGIARKFDHKRAWAGINHRHLNPRERERNNGGTHQRRTCVDLSGHRRRIDHVRVWKGLEPCHPSPCHHTTGNNQPTNCRIINCMLINSLCWSYDWRRWKHDVHMRPLGPNNLYNEMMKRYSPRLSHARNWTWGYDRKKCYHRFIIYVDSRKDRRGSNRSHASCPLLNH